MFRRARSMLATLATLLALAMQWCVPVARAAHAAVHQNANQHHHDHHHGHDHESDEGGSSDESRCPTCQQLAMLRAVELPGTPVVVGFIDLLDVDEAPAFGGPLNGSVRHSPAAPRGPPVA